MYNKNKTDFSYQSRDFIRKLELDKENQSKKTYKLKYKKGDLINYTLEKCFNDEQQSKISCLDNA
ncbi:hypothetical protein [Wolbachia endosymbiont of Chironomus riparius]|uniref:hypothetical protein n=1 Tax=Wolbachia endosymbiont of Chironomus riparius TaxID=2883238 RepID=UPI0020A224A7|nr:hypothetical protein [Wolbachia endosymbiont of Chironomus riparius]